MRKQCAKLSPTHPHNVKSYIYLEIILNFISNMVDGPEEPFSQLLHLSTLAFWVLSSSEITIQNK